MEQIRIINGLLYNGEKRSLEHGDLIVKGDTISDIGPDLKGEGETVDARGKVVSPGFIDIHGHSDSIPLLDCDGGSKLCDGVTTEIAGNCGASIFPDDGRYGEGMRYCPFTGMPYKLESRNLAEYLDQIEKDGLPLNMGFLIGHGALRAAVMGREDRPITPEEVSRMRDMLADHLDQGGIGLSTGLAYPPGCFADTEELFPLGEEIEKRGLIATSHIREEGNTLLESLKEFVSVGETTGCKLQISHLKASWPKNWHKSGKALAWLNDCREKGIDLTADRYTYTASSTSLDYLLPKSWFDGGNEKELEKLHDASLMPELERTIAATYSEDVYDSVQVVNIPNVDEFRKYCGMRVSAIAEDLGVSPFEAYVDILVRSKVHASAVYHSMLEENLENTLKQDFVFPASDALYRSKKGITAKGVPHPRGFGTFSRFLGKYVRERRIMSLEEGLHKITAMPAERFGLKKRGYLKKGCKADITIFDPEKIIDQATFINPHQYSQGIDCVFVNGIKAAENGEVTGVKSGEVVRG